MCNVQALGGAAHSFLGANSLTGAAGQTTTQNVSVNGGNHQALTAVGGQFNSSGLAPLTGNFQTDLKNVLGELKGLLTRLQGALQGQQPANSTANTNASNTVGANFANTSNSPFGITSNVEQYNGPLRQVMIGLQQLLQNNRQPNNFGTNQQVNNTASGVTSNDLQQLIQLLNQLLQMLNRQNNQAGGNQSGNSQFSLLLNQLQDSMQGLQQSLTTSGNTFAGGTNGGAQTSVGGNGAAAATNINGNGSQVLNLVLNGANAGTTTGQNVTSNNQTVTGAGNVAVGSGRANPGAPLTATTSGAKAGIGGNGAAASTNINGNNNTVINIAINAGNGANPVPQPIPLNQKTITSEGRQYNINLAPNYQAGENDQAFFEGFAGRTRNQEMVKNGWNLVCVNTSNTATWEKDGQTQQATSPVAFDLNNDGQIGTTGQTTAQNGNRTSLGKTVSFDIDANGSQDNIEWMNGDGDGLLVDNSDGKAAQSMDGSRLFGDQGGKYTDGYAKLSQRDGDGDGNLTGSELDGLNVWVDNGDANVQDGELKSLSDLGITSISAKRNDVTNDKGETLMRSSATMNGKDVMTEDVWFGKKN